MVEMQIEKTEDWARAHHHEAWGEGKEAANQGETIEVGEKSSVCVCVCVCGKAMKKRFQVGKSGQLTQLLLIGPIRWEPRSDHWIY